MAARGDIGLIEVTKARFDLNHLAREVVASLPDNRVRIIGETTIAPSRCPSTRPSHGWRRHV